MNNNNLKYYRGAIVEVMENCGTMSIIKIKGGAKLRVESTQLLGTDENKTRLPEWITVGACAYLDGDILTITRVGNTQYEATGIKYNTHQGAINYLLHHGRAVVECDTDREPIQRPADYDKLTNITVDDLHIDTDNIFELMTTANEAGADNLAAYAHGLMCSGDQPDTDTITDLIEGLLWTLQEDVEENEAEAEEVREKIEKTKAEGYEVYIDSCDDTNDPATTQNAKKLFNEDIADNLSYLDDLYNNYIYPALSRLRAFVAAFSTDGATTDDPAQCIIDFEAVADAAPAAELPAPPAVVYVSEPCPPTPTDTAAPSSEKIEKKRVRIVAGSFDGCDAILFKVVNKIYGRIKIDNGQYIGFSGSGRFSFFKYDNRAEAVEEMKKYVNNTLSPLGNVIVTFTDPEEHPDRKPRTYQPAADVIAEPVPAADAEAVEAWQNEQAAATVTDADVLAQAARIKAIYEDMKAEADSQPAGMSCDDLPDTTPIYTAADVEAMIEAATADTYTAEEVAAMMAAAVAEERARHTRRRFAPRLRPVLRRLGRVAAVVLPLLIVALFIGASTSSAPAADAAAVTTCQAAETVAHVIDLPAVTVTDTPATPSPVKKLAAPSPVKKAATDIATATAPAADDADSLTTAPAAPMAPAADADGLTICEGTPWAYTMMNWA